MRVFMTIFNRFTWAIDMCEKFTQAGLEVVLIDNKSTYPPCIEWLKNCNYKVLKGTNDYGPWEFTSTDLFKQYPDRFFILSDSDYDISQVPDDFPEFLMKGLENTKHPEVWKAGFSLEINDFPKNKYTDVVFEHESSFWATPQDELGFYHSWVDVGIALYDRERRKKNWYDALRAPRPYTCRHLDWYLTPETVREEDIYYFEVQSHAHYGWGRKWYNEIYLNKKPT
jgi:hypothetical protein